MPAHRKTSSLRIWISAEPLGPKSPGGAGAQALPRRQSGPPRLDAAPPPSPRAPLGSTSPYRCRPAPPAVEVSARWPGCRRRCPDPLTFGSRRSRAAARRAGRAGVRFRSVLAKETLGRARAIYEQRDLEAARLREVATALKGQLDEVLPQLGQLRYLPDRLAQLQAALEQERARADGAETQASGFEQQLASSEADRRDLARALAEVEAELPTAKAALDEERMGRAAVDEELTTLKESLHEAEEKARALEVEARALGNLDGQRQYQEMASTVDRLDAECARMVEEVRTLTTERDAAFSERDALRGEVQALSDDSKQATAALAHARSSLGSLQGEQEWNKSSLTEAQGRVRYLEGELTEARQRAQALEESAAQMAEASSEELGEARDSLAALKAEKASRDKEVEALRAQLEKQMASLQERAREVQALQKSEKDARHEAEARAEKTKAVERQLQVEAEKRAQTMPAWRRPTASCRGSRARTTRPAR